MEASTLQAPASLSRLSVTAPLLRLRTDEQLVALVRAGSDEAFRAIHDRYRTRLLAYARHMLGSASHDAEDVLQDVFVRAHAALRNSDRPISLRAWLYRVAHNRCIDQLRRPVPNPADVFEVSRRPLCDPPLECERRDDLRRLVIDVDRLPDHQRSALLMREMQGMSYEEMAQAMDVSVAAIKSLLVRARGGLVDSAHARDAACATVRSEVALACDRGVRGSGLVRRHLRDCPGCREYRDRLRGARRRLAALAPVGPLGVLAQAAGLGGGGGAAVAGAGGAATLSGAGALMTATKVALVCAAAATAGTGALEVAHRELHRAPAAARPAGRQAPPWHTAAPASVSALPAFDGAVSLRAPAAELALLVAVRSLVDPAPVAATAPAATPHHHVSPQPQFITGQDVYPVSPNPSSSSSTGPGQGTSPGNTSASNSRGSANVPASGAGTSAAPSSTGTSRSSAGSTAPAGAPGGSASKTSPSGSPAATSSSQAGATPAGAGAGQGAGAPPSSPAATTASAAPASSSSATG